MAGQTGTTAQARPVALTGRTLILGEGVCGRRIAAALEQSGIDVLLAEPTNAVGPPPAGSWLEWLPGSRLVRSRGVAGNFQVALQNGSGVVERSVGSMVIAVEALQQTNIGGLGLTPGGRVGTLTGLAAPGAAPPAAGSQVVFVVGLDREATPAVTGEAMSRALQFQQAGARCTILTRNLKVAATGLERRFQTCREAGVLFCKLDPNESPRHEALADGRSQWRFTDEMTRETFQVTADLTVVDEVASPGAELIRLAEVLELQRGTDGFIGTGNVRRPVTLTARRGILAAGPARGLVDPAGQALDADNAAAALRAFHGGHLPPAPRPAEIDQGRCVRCLTCYRLCPYRAVVLEDRVTVRPEACEGCGICAAECPNVAIRIEGLDRSGMTRHLTTPPEAAHGAIVVGTSPRLVAFLCSRSAVPAWAAARAEGQTPPRNLTTVAVPCAGGVSLEHLLAAFQAGADGVLVIGCHSGNCHSESGTTLARSRVEHLAGLLAGLGIDAKRLGFFSLAANMAAECGRLIADFEARLIGPDPAEAKKSADGEVAG